MCVPARRDGDRSAVGGEGAAVELVLDLVDAGAVGAVVTREGDVDVRRVPAVGAVRGRRRRRGGRRRRRLVRAGRAVVRGDPEVVDLHVGRRARVRVVARRAGEVAGGDDADARARARRGASPPLGLSCRPPLLFQAAVVAGKLTQSAFAHCAGAMTWYCPTTLLAPAARV